VHRRKLFGRLQFDDNSALDDQVDAEALVELHAIETRTAAIAQSEALHARRPSRGV
jgi:hypothetical protein